MKPQKKNMSVLCYIVHSLLLWLVVFVWRHYNQPLKQAFFKPFFLN